MTQSLFAVGIVACRPRSLRAGRAVIKKTAGRPKEMEDSNVLLRLKK